MTPRTRADMLQLATDMRSVNDPLLARDMEAVKDDAFLKDPTGYAKFYYDFIHNHYLPMKMKGTLPPNWADMNDPKSLISQAVTRATVPLPAAIGANGGIGAPLSVYTAPTSKTVVPAAPPKGTIRAYRGMQYEFQGGNPRDEKNWKPVGGALPAGPGHT